MTLTKDKGRDARNAAALKADTRGPIVPDRRCGLCADPVAYRWAAICPKCAGWIRFGAAVVAFRIARRAAL